MSYQPTFFDQLSPERILRQDKANGVDPYVFNDDIVIAVDVALATGRPLLVSGLPGAGKSRLADAVAALIGIRYGTLQYQTTEGTKSVEGSVAFFFVAFLSVLVPLLVFTEVDRVGRTASQVNAAIGVGVGMPLDTPSCCWAVLSACCGST